MLAWLRNQRRRLARRLVWAVFCAVAGCTSSAYERAEDAWCADVKRDVPKLAPGPLQSSAMAAEQACDVEEAFEGDGGAK